MSYTAQNLTVDGAAPVELFTFTVLGTTLAWRYCTDTKPWVFGADTWIPEAISRSEVSRTVEETSTPLSVFVGDENPFALALLAGLTSRPVSVQVEQFHRTDAGLERIVVFTGRTAGVSFSGPKATIACVSRLSVANRRKVPWQTYQAGCNWQWGSEQCGVNKDTFKLGPFTITAAQAPGSRMYLPGTAPADGDLSNGWVVRDADGDSRFIEQQVGAQLYLQTAFPDVAVAGESFTVFPGCRRTEADCNTRYNNLPNFLGWPRLPSLNPFARSAFYLAAAATVAPPAGTTADAGSGYTLVLAPTSAAMRVGGNYSGFTSTTVAIRLTPDGYAGLSQPGLTGILSPLPDRYISPRPCPPSVTADYEVFFSSSGVAQGSLSDSISVALGSGFDTWLPLTSAQEATVTVGTQGNGTQGRQRTVAVTTSVHIRVRKASTGIVQAEGTMSLSFSAIIGSQT